VGTRPLPATDLTAGLDSGPATTAAGPDPLTDHDLFARGVPHELFRTLRHSDPVHWTPWPSGQGFWSVTRYDDVVEVSRDVASFSSQTGATALEDLESDALAARVSMLDLDPPQHTPLRQSVTAPLTRRAVARYDAPIRAVVRDVLDATLPLGEFDLVETVARRIPIRVLAQLLGVPPEDEEYLVTLSDRLIANTDPDLTDVVFDADDTDPYRLLPFRNPASLELHAYGRRLAERRLAEPRADLVSSLVHGTGGQSPLRGRDFDAMFLLLVVAGNETTRSALALGVQALVEHPDQWDLLRRLGPDALPAATEELLRWTTPLHHFRRTATRDTTIAGRPVRAGDKVVVWYPAANRDETVFPDPDAFDITRDPNPHVAFGRGGPHRCVGEHLARLEIWITLEELLARVDRLEATGPAPRVRSNFVNGLKSLPVRALPLPSPSRSSSRPSSPVPAGDPS
jgi:cytochrome P450